MSVACSPLAHNNSALTALYTLLENKLVIMNVIFLLDNEIVYCQIKGLNVFF